MADNRIHDASWDVVNSIRETNQTLANSAVAAVDRNMKFAQSVFSNWTEVLESQTEDMRHLMREWDQQVKRQQEAFQRLAYATMDVYLSFLRIPFSFYRQVIDTAEEATQRGLGYAQNVAHQSIDAATSAARQTTDTTGAVVQRGLDQAQKTTRQGQQAAQKQGE